MSYNNRCGCGIDRCGGGCGFNNNCGPNNCGPQVRVEVGCADDISCAPKQCNSPCNKPCDPCAPPFTVDQIVWINSCTDNKILNGAVGPVNMINQKVNVITESAAQFRSDIARKVICIENQISCVAGIECRIAESEKQLMCQIQKLETLVFAQASALQRFECATARQLKDQAFAINQLNNGFCAEQEFQKMQIRLDNFQLQFDATVAQMLSQMPQCSSSQARVAQLPIGGVNGSCNTRAGMPLYPAGKGVACGVNPMGPYNNQMFMTNSAVGSQQLPPPMVQQLPPPMGQQNSMGQQTWQQQSQQYGQQVSQGLNGLGQVTGMQQFNQVGQGLNQGLQSFNNVPPPSPNSVLK